MVADKKEPVSSGVCLTEIAGSKLCVVRALCALVRFGIQTPFVDEKSSIKSIERDRLLPGQPLNCTLLLVTRIRTGKAPNCLNLKI